MKKLFGIFIFSITAVHTAAAATQALGNIGDPIPVSCVNGVFTKTGGPDWAKLALTLTNNCGKDVNFQKSSITFSSNTKLDTNFWGDFAPLSYPDNVLTITSQPNPTSGYTASLFLHFPEEPWVKTILHDKESFIIRYGAPWIHSPTNAKIYIDGPPPVSGEIDIKNDTAQPPQVTQSYAVVKLILNGQTVNSVQVPWATMLPVKNLAPGTYTIEPVNVVDTTQQRNYVGSAIPNPVTVTAGQTTNTVVSYKPIIIPGAIKVQTPALPSSLVGYTGIPLVNFTRIDTGALVTKEVPWNTTTTVSTLENNAIYQMSTPTIVYNNNNCVGNFNPSSLASNNTNPQTTQLSYTCTSVLVDKVNVTVTGLPCGSKSMTVTFTPASGTPVNKTINISGGSGIDTINLSDGVVYNVSVSPVEGYDATFSPQPIMAKPDVTEAVTFFPVPRKK